MSAAARLCALISLLCFAAKQAAAMSAPAKVRIAMCQVLTVDSDRAGNFARIEKALAEAKQGGAQIARIPEGSVLGWENPEAHRLAHPIPGKDAERFQQLARRFDMMLCAGLDEKDGDRLYGAVILADRSGGVREQYKNSA